MTLMTFSRYALVFNFGKVSADYQYQFYIEIRYQNQWAACMKFFSSIFLQILVVLLDFSKKCKFQKKNEIFEFPYKKQVFLWCKVQNVNIQD
jgi:hypothetical protein